MRNSNLIDNGNAFAGGADNSALINAMNERTSSRIAAIAARGLDDPSSLTLEEVRSVCASALTQAPDR